MKLMKIVTVHNVLKLHEFYITCHPPPFVFGLVFILLFLSSNGVPQLKTKKLLKFALGSQNIFVQNIFVYFAEYICSINTARYFSFLPISIFGCRGVYLVFPGRNFGASLNNVKQPKYYQIS